MVELSGQPTYDAAVEYGSMLADRRTCKSDVFKAIALFPQSCDVAPLEYDIIVENEDMARSPAKRITNTDIISVTVTPIFRVLYKKTPIIVIFAVIISRQLMFGFRIIIDNGDRIEFISAV